MYKLCHLALGLALSAGCMVNGKPLFGGGASGGNSSTTAGAPAPAQGGDEAERTLDLYKKYTFKNVTAPDATTQFSKMGIPSTFNPKRKMKNPDPAWIPGWDKLELTDETQTAILQAAINRTWQVYIHAQYAAYRKAWATIETELRPHLAEALAMAEYHTQGAALAKLYKTAMERATASGITPPKEYRFVGFVGEIVRAMVDLHRSTNNGFRLDAYLGALSISLADVEASSRPYAAEPVERDLYTLAHLRDLPALNEYGHAFAAVKWPVDERAAKATRTKLVTDATATLAEIKRVPNVPSLFDGSSGDDRDPTLRWIGGGSGSIKPVLVTKVSRKGGGTEVELASSTERSIPYGCKDTNQLSTIEPGTFVKDCKYKTEVTRYTLEVTFPALPLGVELAKGDEVQLYGDLVDTKRAKLSAKFTIKARAIASIKRGGKTVATYW